MILKSFIYLSSYSSNHTYDHFLIGFLKSHSGCENNSIILRIPFHRISDAFILLLILLTIYSYLKSIRIFLVFSFNRINSAAYQTSIFYVQFQLDNKLWAGYKQVINIVFKYYYSSMLVQWICSQIIFAIMYQKKSICYLDLTFVLTLEVNTKAILEETFSKLNKNLIYRWMLRRKSHE